LSKYLIIMQNYPKHLADVVKEHWNKRNSAEAGSLVEDAKANDDLAGAEILKRLLAICFEASLLRDEGRGVRFRLMLRDPHLFSHDDASPSGLQHLVFAKPISFETNELRRLAQAAPFERALIGVRASEEDRLEIWGIIHSGSDWRRALEGSRCLSNPLPPSLVVSVIDPGHMSLAKGSEMIGGLVAGRLTMASPIGAFVADASTAENSIEGELYALHEQARRGARRPWARLDPTLVRSIRQSLGLRLISAIRNGRHGGTIVIVPGRMAQRPATLDRYVRVKYRFSASASQRRFYDLLLHLMNALAESEGALHGSERLVGWKQYASSVDPSVIEIDEALSEQAHLLAGMAAADGAVVLARPLGMVGFGGEICGRLKHVDYVYRALDREAAQVETEATSGVGTRHRSVYRLCNALPAASAIVVSQDGGVRIVRQVNGKVTYWEQLPGDVFGLNGRGVFPPQSVQVPGFRDGYGPKRRGGMRQLCNHLGYAHGEAAVVERSTKRQSAVLAGGMTEHPQGRPQAASQLFLNLEFVAPATKLNANSEVFQSAFRFS
jgi:hypothetical protein